MGSRKLSEDVIFAVKKVKLKSREQTIPGRGNIMWKVLRLERRPVSWNISGARGTGLKGARKVKFPQAPKVLATIGTNWTIVVKLLTVSGLLGLCKRNLLNLMVSNTVQKNKHRFLCHIKSKVMKEKKLFRLLTKPWFLANIYRGLNLCRVPGGAGGVKCVGICSLGEAAASVLPLMPL